MLSFAAGSIRSAALLSVCLMASCASPAETDRPPCEWYGPDPCGTVHAARLTPDGRFDSRVYPVPALQFDSAVVASAPDSVLGREPPRTEDARAGLTHPERDTVLMVTLRDDKHFAPFPEPFQHEPPTSSANRDVLARADEHVRQILAQREQSRDAVLADLDPSEYEILEQFWLIDAFVIRTSQRNFRTIVDRAEVRFVDPVSKPPPALPDSAVHHLARSVQQLVAAGMQDAGSPVAAAREWLGSDDYYRRSELRHGWVGLIDSGISAGHLLFNAPTSVARRGDCVNGGSTCFDLTDRFDPDEACRSMAHGTSSAAILTANANMGEQYRGVLDGTLDTFRIFYCHQYDDGQLGTQLNYIAAVRGIQAAVRSLDKVIIGELTGISYECELVFGQCDYDDGHLRWSEQISLYHGLISHAANKAFDLGTVVVSAVGNTPGRVTQPGDAHRVIAVSAVDIQSRRMNAAFGWGPTPDGRHKPDIVAPTNTITAGGLTPAWLRKHTGTSGATPYAAGSAILLRNWLKRTSSPDTSGWRRRSVDPGQVYAQLILSGQSTYPFSDTTGAGVIALPEPDGDSFRGKIVLDSTGVVATVPLHVSTLSVDRLDAALWWPESFGRPHNFISLEIVDGSGVVRASSSDLLSVFQRARADSAGALDGWTIRITGRSVEHAPQVVYWAAHAR